MKAVNINLTLRNWLIGFYIVEFEQQGDDRATYGAALLSELAKKIAIRGLGETNLKLCRQFYFIYPDLLHIYLGQNPNILPSVIRQLLTDNSQYADNQSKNRQLSIYKFNSKQKGTSSDDKNYLVQLVNILSFTHIVELIKIESDNKRRFYELLILKTTPSVRALKRSINTLTYERLGLSQNKEQALQKIHDKINPQQTTDLFKSHYFFEFLDIKQPQLIEETDLEQALIDHLQQFMLEMGNGFCFEARQKRILIGEEYYFIDLVFYHRILKCHILVELKADKANHEHIGQLKTYLNYYKKNMQERNDNPPVGILLVTDQNKTLVEYAIADSDKDIFVSKYLLQLPDKKKLEAFVNNELKKL